jgi:hypothetical protein
MLAMHYKNCQKSKDKQSILKQKREFLNKQKFDVMKKPNYLMKFEEVRTHFKNLTTPKHPSVIIDNILNVLSIAYKLTLYSINGPTNIFKHSIGHFSESLVIMLNIKIFSLIQFS